MTSCATILHPERREQPAGKLDTDMVILDGFGLLLFLLPGVIAFAVDFSTGAIYLPTGESSRTREILGEVDSIDSDPTYADHDVLAEPTERYSAG